MAAPRRMRIATRGSYSASRAASRWRCQAQASDGEKLAGTLASAGRAISSMRAPAERSDVIARSKARATVSSSASRITVAGTAKRSAATGLAASATHRSASTSCSSTASRTERVIAQAVSSVVESGIAPCLGVSRAVFLKPTSPCSAAGMRIEPPVSEPIAAHAAPVATETAPPEVEPPGMRGSASSKAVAGLAGVPKCGLMPTPEKANSDMFVRPISAAPARRKRATAGQSAAAGGFVASTVEPAAVTSPRTSNRSFTLIARPASVATGAPASCRASIARATSAAASNEVLMKVYRFASDRADSRHASRRAEALECAREPVRSGVMEMLELNGSAGHGLASCCRANCEPAIERCRDHSCRDESAAKSASRFKPDSRTNLWSPHDCHHA